jgi:hypothetical protein
MDGFYYHLCQGLYVHCPSDALMVTMGMNRKVAELTGILGQDHLRHQLVFFQGEAM